MKVTDLKGQMHVFTLTDGTTLRVPSRKSVPVKDNLISKEVKLAADMGLIRLSQERTNELSAPRAKGSKDPATVSDQSRKEGDA